MAGNPLHLFGGHWVTKFQNMTLFKETWVLTTITIWKLVYKDLIIPFLHTYHFFRCCIVPLCANMYYTYLCACVLWVWKMVHTLIFAGSIIYSNDPPKHDKFRGLRCYQWNVSPFPPFTHRSCFAMKPYHSLVHGHPSFEVMERHS